MVVMDYKLMQIAKIEENIVLEFGILPSAIIREWHTNEFVYVESNYLIYKRRIKQTKKEISMDAFAKKYNLYYS